MSATGRGSTRFLLDDYATPGWSIDRLLDRVALPVGRYLECSAHDGLVIDRLREHPRTRDRLREVVAVEIDKAAHPILASKADVVHWGDFLKLAPTLGHFDCAPGNPPYKLAQRFVETLLPMADVVALLLRHNFLGSAERHALWRRNMPDTMILPQRPTFVIRVRLDKKGRLTITTSDSCEYAWFIWRARELPRSEGRTALLDLTSEEEAAAWRKLAPIIFEDPEGNLRRIDRDELTQLRTDANARRRKSDTSPPLAEV
ncbi:MAG: hypothetical protein EKK55_06965 [Rhodocyclaceae bacterium]|nr:MAG: hypothetical protein EKK55_06965 [Rhodocyclaceae bacterium]